MGFLIRIAAQATAAAAAVFVLYLLIQSAPEDGDAPVESAAAPETRPRAAPSTASSLIASATAPADPSSETPSAATAPSAPAAQSEPSAPSAPSALTGALADFAARQEAADELGVFVALKRTYPASYDALIRDLFAAEQSGADGSALARRRAEFVSRVLAEKLQFAPFADATALNTYFEYNINLLRLVRERFGVEACADVVRKGGGALRARLRDAPSAEAAELVQLLGAQTGVMLDVARAGETAGARELEPPQGTDWRDLYQKMERLGVTPTQILEFRAGALSAEEAICDVTRSYYGALLSLDADVASRLHPFVVRSMVSGGARN